MRSGMWVSRFTMVIALGLFISCPRLLQAADVTLAWDPPTDGVTTGYVLYYGTASHSYSQQIDVGYTTSQSFTNLSDGTTYYFAVRAYDAVRVMSDLSQEITASTTSSVPPPVTSLSLNSSLPSPQLRGTTINWLSTATGGVAPYQFQWSLYSAGSWTSSPWTTASSWSWTPSSAGSDYQVRVAVRSAGSTSATGEITQTVPFTVSGPVATNVSLKSNLSAPRATGTTILWSASPVGGIAPYQYKWWVYDGSVWTAVTTWTTNSSWSWSPTLANSAYVVGVWVRSAGNAADAAETSTSTPFAITTATSSPNGKGNCQGRKCR
jgi:hypothetical protein